MAQGIRYSFVSSTGLVGSGILNISGDRAELKTKSGQSKTVCYQDVKSVGITSGSLEFSLVDGSSKSFGVDREMQEEILDFVRSAVEPYIAEKESSSGSGDLFFLPKQFGAGKRNSQHF